jgi:hypothetical protein
MTRDDIERDLGVAGTVGVTTQEGRQRSTQRGGIGFSQVHVFIFLATNGHPLLQV